MRKSASLLVLILASSALVCARKDEDVQQLKARLATVAPEQQISISLKIAEQQLKAADKLYTDGKSDEARAAVNEVVTYSQKASEAAASTGKKLKQAEISVRKMAHRLRDIKRSVNFEDQQPLQDAADHLERFRSDLLTRMFGPSKK
jgi:hypothetical protein